MATSERAPLAAGAARSPSAIRDTVAAAAAGPLRAGAGLPPRRGRGPGWAALVAEIPEAESIRINNEVYELQAAGTDVVVLSLGEAFFDLPAFPFPATYHYGSSRGLADLRGKLAAAYYGVPVDPAREIILTPGSKLAIYMVLAALLDPGDEVVILEPAWVSYREQVRLCRGHPVHVPVGGDPADYVGPRTKVLIVNNPQNPQGRVHTGAELAVLHGLAERHGFWLLADEAYSDFVVAPDAFVSAGAGDPDKHHTIICNSLSKNLGISGWRLGYAIGAAPLMAQILKINQHLATCPPTVLEAYVAAHFDELRAAAAPQIRDVVRRRQAAADHLRRLGIESLPGTATFYLFVRVGASGSAAFAQALLRRFGVAVVPGIGYGASCDGFVRVSVGTETEARVRLGLDRLGALSRT